MNQRLEAVNAVTARNELLSGINPSTVRLKFTDAGIIDPLSGKKLEECFDFADPIQKRISEINMKMMKELERRSGVGIWLNPGRENKILIATVNKGDPILYDVTGRAFSATEFASFMTSLSPYAHDGHFFLEDDTAWGILESIIPMPLAWQAIRNDQAEMKFNADVEEVMQRKNKRRFYQEKHGVDIALACGGTVATLKLVSPNGEITEAGKLYYVKNCGQCGVVIEKQIPAGYCCPNCGGIFEGCG